MTSSSTIARPRTTSEPVIGGRAVPGAVIITVLRVPILVVTGLALAHLPILAAAALTMFVALDILDGSFARSHGGDSARRRGLDSIIDRSSVVALFGVAALRGSDVYAIASLSIAAVSVVAIPLALHNFRRGMVLRAPRWHRSWSVSAYVAGLSYLVASQEIGAWLALASAVLCTICTLTLLCEHVVLSLRVSSVV